MHAPTGTLTETSIDRLTLDDLFAGGLETTSHDVPHNVWKRLAGVGIQVDPPLQSSVLDTRIPLRTIRWPARSQARAADLRVADGDTRKQLDAPRYLPWRLRRTLAVLAAGRK